MFRVRYTETTDQRRTVFRSRSFLPRLCGEGVVLECGVNFLKLPIWANFDFQISTSLVHFDLHPSYLTVSVLGMKRELDGARGQSVEQDVHLGLQKYSMPSAFTPSLTQCASSSLDVLRQRHVGQ